MPRMKDDEIRFRHALAATGKRIEDVDPLELAKKAKVSSKRAKHIARSLTGPALPPVNAVPKAPEGKAKADAVVQG